MRKTLFATAVAGLLVSGYLYSAYISGAPIPCTIHGGCEIVRASQYAQFFGLPTPLFGIVYYLLLAIGALLLASPYSSRIRIPLLVVTGMGLLVSAYLTYLEAFVIHAWCLWCVASALLTVIAFGLVWGTLGLRKV